MPLVKSPVEAAVPRGLRDRSSPSAKMPRMLLSATMAGRAKMTVLELHMCMYVSYVYIYIHYVCVYIYDIYVCIYIYISQYIEIYI